MSRISAGRLVEIENESLKKRVKMLEDRTKELETLLQKVTSLMEHCTGNLELLAKVTDIHTNFVVEQRKINKRKSDAN